MKEVGLCKYFDPEKNTKKRFLKNIYFDPRKKYNAPFPLHCQNIYDWDQRNEFDENNLFDIRFHIQ